MSFRSSLCLVITSSALSGLSALVLVWPTTLHAEDPEAAAEVQNAIELAPNATRFGDIVASSELVTDENTKKHRIRFVAINTSSEHEADAKIEVNVMKMEVDPGSRVGPTPELADEQTFRIVLPPGERDVRELPVGAELAKSLKALEKRKKQAASGDPQVELPDVYETYEAIVRIPSEASEPGPDADPALAQAAG